MQGHENVLDGLVLGHWQRGKDPKKMHDTCDSQPGTEWSCPRLQVPSMARIVSRCDELGSLSCSLQRPEDSENAGQTSSDRSYHRVEWDWNDQLEHNWLCHTGRLQEWISLWPSKRSSWEGQLTVSECYVSPLPQLELHQAFHGT